uniref:Uncharacterized protein n=1 Tax=Mimivirus LCMiAC01 TaxID=2506608 RepID=A0A481YZY2_9VIRU|nr:MAG: uncharacterized protein LCMiAC01_04600 [Mimivirus LCMiAC01]
MNSPHVPNAQKKIITERYKERQKKKYPPRKPVQQNPLVNLQVYPFPRPPKPRPKGPRAEFYMPISTTVPTYPPQYMTAYPMGPPFYKPATFPIIKNYEISVAGPTVDHNRVSAIYEDVIPSNKFNDTFLTIEERYNMHNFIRSIFVKRGDGEDIGLDDLANNSISRYLKFMELNPYNTSRYSNNPYMGLPDNMLIYRSCYPIRLDKTVNSTQCAANSLGMNVRIYRLTMGEYQINTKEKSNYYDYNTWREIAWYEYIRENIIKQKVCPNFPIMFAYFICSRCNIDFHKIAEIKGRSKKKPDRYVIRNDDGTIRETVNELKKYFNVRVSVDKALKHKSITDVLTRPPLTVELNAETYTNKGLIALTESPTHNIYSWASRTYKVIGNIRKMVNDGYHKSKVWFSVLFQLMTALYVMQLHGLAFYEFDIQSNVYIKDIRVYGNITRYWKYIIDGIEFYIPNYGYIVLIDSNFKDNTENNFTLGAIGKPKYKIYSNIYTKDSGDTYKSEQIHELCFEAFKKSINPDKFSQAFVNMGGTKPPEDVIKLLSDIQHEISATKNIDIGHYIIKHMGMFLNNRIGTYLNNTEVKNIRRSDNTQYHKGQIVVYSVSHDTYKFGLYYKRDNDMVYIYTKKEPSDFDIIIPPSFSYTKLLHYSRHNKLIQNYQPQIANLNEDDLLETYSISNPSHA